MKVYIHYNALDFGAPTGATDRWHNYTNPDSAKMFLVCAESWRRQGFEPIRLNSHGVTGFRFKGALNCAFEYPLEFWNIWFQLLKLAPCFFTSIDVINYGFSNHECERLCLNQYAVRAYPGNMYSLSFNATENWTNACCFVTKEFCENAIDLCYQVDSGKLPIPGCVVTTDEAILRENRDKLGPHLIYTCYHSRSHLVHYHRSMLVNALDLHPVYAGD